ncbi:MFS transporter [Arenivirga flava]|uniref:MFS transporter n=1 Tax=Arenivirga flava TaxID=1930060 RepID=A0AA37UNK8_9MICO|nr:MFS transporter [Arenivirga flava]GMA26947.1 MFS transporter [Arenivirga flava]
MTSPASAAPGRKDHRWLGLAIIAIAQLMVVLDATIVNIALPSAQQALGFADEQRQWVITAYALAFGSLLLLGGRLGDLFGRKNTFIIGLVGFALASVLGGFAESFEVLVAARALQGVFGALLAPSALGMLTTTFIDPRERGRAFGIFGSIAGSGAAVGMLLGGLLTEYSSWRWCLFVNVVFAVVGVIGGAVLLRTPPRAQRPRIDVAGVVTITAGLVGIVWGFSAAETDGWDSPLAIGLLVGGALLVVAFVLIERRVAQPLLPLRIVLDRDRGGALLAISMSSIGMFGIFLFLTYYLQGTLGFGALQTGLAFLPMPASIMLSATQIGGRLLPRVGPKLLIGAGGMLGAAGLLLLLRTEADSTYAAVVLPALIVIGLGMGLIFSSAMNTATTGVARQDAGVASATVNTGQQIGGAIGTALLSTIFADALDRGMSDAAGDPSASAEALMTAYHTAFTVSAGAMLLVSVAAIALIRPHRERQARLAAVQPNAPSGSVPTVAH